MFWQADDMKPACRLQMLAIERQYKAKGMPGLLAFFLESHDKQRMGPESVAGSVIYDQLRNLSMDSTTAYR